MILENLKGYLTNNNMITKKMVLVNLEVVKLSS